jgi:hypothetical protein
MTQPVRAETKSVAVMSNRIFKFFIRGFSRNELCVMLPTRNVLGFTRCCGHSGSVMQVFRVPNEFKIELLKNFKR